MPKKLLTTKLDVATRIIQVTQELGCVPHLAPLKPLCAVALVILDNAQAIRKLKDDHEELAGRAAELVVAVLAECAASPSLSTETGNHITALLAPLGEIRDHMVTEAKLRWFERLLRRKDLEEKIVMYNTRLDDCRQEFNIKSLISIRKLLESNPPINRSNLLDLAVSINSNIENVTREVKTGFTSVMDRLDDIRPGPSTVGETPQFRVVRYDEVRLRRTLRVLGHSWLYRGELLGDPEPTMVVVKAYNKNEQGTKEFLRDIHAWQKLYHPNLHRVLGHSSPSASGPFLLLAADAFEGVYEYMRTQLLTGSTEVDTFMSALKLLQGLVSALEFLRCSLMLSKRELSDCTKASNIVVTSDGRVVVGNIAADLQYMLQDAALPGDWFTMILYSFTAQLVRGLVPIDQSDWEWTMARTNVMPTRHLRMLENFVSFLQPSITKMAQDLDATLESLEDLHSRGQVTFPLIRQAVLSHIAGNYIYRPKIPLEVVPGDIGYIEAGKFIVLENVRDILGGKFLDSPSYMFICECEYHIGQPDGTGLLRHRFIRPLYVEIRRHSGSEVISDRRMGWSYFISNAARLYEKHFPKHPGLRFSDIMFVIGVQSDLRYTILDCKAGDNERPQPPDIVDFMEYEPVHPDKPWGYWVVGDATAIDIQEHRHPQDIYFIQLEESELMMGVTSDRFEEVK